MVEGNRLFKSDRQGRWGGEVPLSVRERLDFTVLTIRDDVVESLWMRIREMENKNVVAYVYYHLPSQDLNTNELFYQQLG